MRIVSLSVSEFSCRRELYHVYDTIFLDNRSRVVRIVEIATPGSKSSRHKIGVKEKATNRQLRIKNLTSKKHSILTTNVVTIKQSQIQKVDKKKFQDDPLRCCPYPFAEQCTPHGGSPYRLPCCGGFAFIGVCLPHSSTSVGAVSIAVICF